MTLPPDPVASLRGMLMAYQVSQALHAAAELGLADLLGDGCITSDQLAERSRTHAPTLYRLLRALASIGVLRESEGRRFELAPLGLPLRRGVAGSMADVAAYACRPYRLQAWGALAHSVRTGENAFAHVHGIDPWTYRAGHAEEQAIFDRAMKALSQAAAATAVQAMELGSAGQIVDVGGGNGAMLAAVLGAHPGWTGVLLDQPSVIGVAAPTLEAAGVTARCAWVGGDFFASVPAGADVYLLRAVLHDWEDDDCVRILAAVRRALPDHGRVLVVEYLLSAHASGASAAFSDLNMLVGPGGRERTAEEFAALFEAADLRPGRVRPAGEQCVIEAWAGRAPGN